MRDHYQQLFAHKRRMVALKLWAETKKRRGPWIGADCPAISWDDLGVPFQWCGVLDLREAGLVTMGSTNDGHSGVVLRKEYADAPMSELQETLTRIFERR